MQILIQGPTYGRPQPIRINVGGIQRDIPVNTKVDADEALLGALRDTDHIIQVFGDSAADEQAPAGSGDGGEVGGGISGEPAAATVDADESQDEPEVEPVGPGFLDRSVTLIVADLGNLSLAQLRGAREAEEAGKTRRSLIAAIDERITALAA